MAHLRSNKHKHTNIMYERSKSFPSVLCKFLTIAILKTVKRKINTFTVDFTKLWTRPVARLVGNLGTINMRSSS